jgi:hypothetical protein
MLTQMRPFQEVVDQVVEERAIRSATENRIKSLKYMQAHSAQPEAVKYARGEIQRLQQQLDMTPDPMAESEFSCEDCHDQGCPACSDEDRVWTRAR